jgi:CheY-like chemotaxis protein
MNEALNSTGPATENAAYRDTPAHREFCTQLNHKRRTPLNAIIGFTELLALQPRGTREDEDLQQILKSARDLLQVIERDLGEAAAGEPAPPPDAAASERVCDVLYVEDDLVNFTLVERILDFRPAVTVMHAVQGQLGLALAEAYNPKLILLDLNLPDMHGSEVLRRLQQDAATKHIPVVILSADATPSQIERLLTAGARNYLTKPFDIDPFLAVVDEFLEETPKAAGV